MIKNRSALLWIAPLFLFFLLTPTTPWLDLRIEEFFYNRGAGIENFVSHPLLDFFYVYALIPGQVLFVIACLGLGLSYISPKLRMIRPHSLYLVLTLAIGAGVVSHAILKDHWGRPRPRQVIEFGGQQEFRPFYKPNFFNQPEPSKSFPCGHCTMGFYFFTLVFMGWRLRSKVLLYAGLILSLGLGTILGYTRMAQGGHFFSDVFMSALIMWLTALIFDKMIYEKYV